MSPPPGRMSPPPAGLRGRLPAVAAVVLARLLAAQPPARIRQVLGWLSKGTVTVDYGEALAAQQVVTAVSRVCRAPDGCVPRSIATAVLCRASGGWPTWTVGVRAAAPFGAHAWVEAEGAAVGEADPARWFRPLIVIPPPPEGASGSGGHRGG